LNQDEDTIWAKIMGAKFRNANNLWEDSAKGVPVLEELEQDQTILRFGSEICGEEW
jgi:hypothetical protein